VRGGFVLRGAVSIVHGPLLMVGSFCAGVRAWDALEWV
jgi:hypothetical protein